VVYRRLGELHEERGEYARAAGYYTQFIELWSRADSDLQPNVAAVRAALQRVRLREPR